MSCVIRLARSISPMGWIRQRYREPLSLAAQDLSFSNRSGRIAALRPGEIPTSGGANCKPSPPAGLAPCTLGAMPPIQCP
jgi:hypothetical protein